MDIVCFLGFFISIKHFSIIWSIDVCSRGYLNIHGYIGCLNIHGIHVTANNSTNNKTVFFCASDSKIVYKNNTKTSITMPCTREEKLLCVTTYLIWRQNHSKLSQNRCNPLIGLWFITETRNSKKTACPGSWYNTNKKKHWFGVSSSKMHFYRTYSKCPPLHLSQ